MSVPLFELRGVRFAYPEQEPLFQNLSVSIGGSDRILLRGDNGSGKSTLLSLMAGLLKPSSGTVECAGTPCAELTAEQIRGLVCLRQNSRDNLFGLIPRHDLELWQLALPNQDLARDISTGREPLSAKLDTPYTSLSAGELRACALLTLAWQMEKFWLLDEPTVGLDAARKQRFAQLCADKRGSGCGLLVVSHDPFLERGLFDRVLILESGRIRELP